MNRVEEYYDEHHENEWQRLEIHRVEYGITLRALEEYLPVLPASVVDVGGACGRYAIELARRGYLTTIVDLSSRCLDMARKQASMAGVELAGYIHTDARELSGFNDESTDAVLIMGPLYHLLDHQDRLKAVQEAWRILKPGGLVFASFICKHSVVQWAAVDNPEYIRDYSQELDNILKTGVHRREDGSTGFIDAWFAHPTEIPTLMAEAGFEQIDMLACEPLVNEIESRINETEPELHKVWINLLYQIAKDPTIHGAAGHLLYVGRKP
ncbi:MAG TPA: methyltransferase domain-containing protein [Armatimonadota bacterium]|nr:methyltransferase domain-containing protein [Armatimonadota bacterium]HOM72428.1 methyltransferase domain-containing protein [Armatimonadota bacterium]